MTNNWHYARGGESIGPVTRAELEALVRAGHLGRADMVWHASLPGWVPVEQEFDLSTPTQATPPPQVAAPPPVRPTKVRRRRRPAAPPALSRQLAVWMAGFAAVTTLLVFVMLSSWLAARQNRLRELRAAANSESVARLARPTAVEPPASSSASPRSDPESLDVSASPEPDEAEALPGGEAPPGDMVFGAPGPSAPAAPPVAAPPVAAPPVAVSSVAEAAPTLELQPENPGLPPSRPDPAPESSEPSPARTLYHELEIERRPEFQMLGTVMRREVRYAIWSKLEITPPNEEGEYEVTQTIEDVRLLAADATSRAIYERALQKLIRGQYRYRLGLRHEVIDYDGPPAPSVTGEVSLDAGGGFLLTNVVDRDGWKELIQLSLFRPAENQIWPLERQMRHDWAPLGSWVGRTLFVASAPAEIQFQHDLKYERPVGEEGTLPFRITAADFRVVRGEGKLQLAPGGGRVQEGTEQFAVEGRARLSLLGESVEVRLQEQQHLKIRLSEQPFPWADQP